MINTWLLKNDKYFDKSSGCHLWTRCKANKYGRTSFKGAPWGVHVLIWTFANGPVPSGKLIRHTCHTPACANLDHLKLGTTQDNSDDMVAAARQAKGTKVGGAKLDDELVREIRWLGTQGFSQRALAREFGVSQPLIGLILRREIWTHVKEVKCG